MFFSVDASPDLAIAAGSVSWNPGVPLAGSNTELQAVIRNVGYSPADSADVLFLDTGTGTVLASARVVVQAGDSVTVVTQWTPAQIGEHHVRAQVTLLGAVEINLQNNQTEVVVPVAAAGPVSVPGDADALPRRFELAPPRPNPSRGQVALDFAVPRMADVSLTIYDVAGRLVRKLVDGPVAPGPHTIIWDSRDRSGRRVSSGVYLVRFTAPGVHFARKAVFLQAGSGQ